MFDAVRNNKKITQIFLALITLPFAFWGVDSYVRNSGGGQDLASVGDSKISIQELQGALREQEDRLRQQLGGRVDPAMFNTPEMRRAVLDSLVSQRLLALQSNKNRMTLSDADLVRFIASVPTLQENGKFSPERYAALVASQGLSKEAFEQRLRYDLAMQQVAQPVGDASMTGKLPMARWAMAQLEQRDVAEFKLQPTDYVAKVSLSDDAISKYYDANKSRFELPEQVRVEYLSLSQETLQAQVRVSDEEIGARYKAKAANYTQPESRRASHILIRIAKDAPDSELKTAQAKAEEVLGLVKKLPNDFSRLAKEHSQDPGSAEKGGDLDWFSRGMMVKPFEDTVFSLKDGETSGIVRSDFGLHIIRVTGVRAEKAKPLAEVKSEIQAELLREQTARLFAEAAESFGNMVYEQSDSLKPAADKWKLTVRSSEWLSKGKKLPAPFDNAKLSNAVFSEDAIKHHRNTEAIEIASGNLVAARVVEHRPASLQALETVKDAIRKQLLIEEAAKLAQKEGEETLSRLAKGEEPKLAWGPVRSVLRATPAGFSPDAARAVFKLDASKLPAYTGTAIPGGGYALYRVTAVKQAAENDPRAVSLTEQYARMVAEEEFTAWLSTLRQQFPVKINSTALEAK
jgi:peptidyl-prolyl cis-trans isomerase D